MSLYSFGTFLDSRETCRKSVIDFSVLLLLSLDEGILDAVVLLGGWWVSQRTRRELTGCTPRINPYYLQYHLKNEQTIQIGLLTQWQKLCINGICLHQLCIETLIILHPVHVMRLASQCEFLSWWLCRISIFLCFCPLTFTWRPC